MRVEQLKQLGLVVLQKNFYNYSYEKEFIRLYKSNKLHNNKIY